MLNPNNTNKLYLLTLKENELFLYESLLKWAKHDDRFYNTLAESHKKDLSIVIDAMIEKKVACLTEPIFSSDFLFKNTDKEELSIEKQEEIQNNCIAFFKSTDPKKNFGGDFRC